MKSKLLARENIVVKVLKPDNYEEYAEMLKSFDSRDKSINFVVKKRVECFREKGSQYDNRDTIYLYLFEDPDTKVRELIGYLSFAASSLDDKLSSQERVVIPSVVINTFAVSKRFTEKSGIRVDMGDGLSMKCSVYIIEDFFSRMDNLSKKIGLCLVYLFAQQRGVVLDFYRDNCDFVQFSRSQNVFGLEADSREYSLLRVLENSKYRGI